MERSTRFLSLSGLSSISAGIVALLGALIAFFILYQGYTLPGSDLIWYLILDGIVVLVLSIVAGFYFSWRKANQKKLPFWNQTARRTLYFFALPLLAGGLFTIILIVRNDVALVAPTMLIFYGLALFSASNYTFGEIQFLGISEILLGILAGIFIDFGLLFWALGFGVLHIIYGFVIYARYS